MRRFTSGVTLVLVMMTGACGGDRPKEAASTAPAASPGNPKELKPLETLLLKEPKAAITGLEAYVAKYPTDARGHWVLARAIKGAAPVLPGEYTDADRTALERAAQHQRKVLALSADGDLREAANIELMDIYGTLRLNRPEEVIEPAKQLIAMSATLSDPHYHLANALVRLKRPDEAVQVWSDAEKTLRGRDRRVIAAGINAFAGRHPEKLTDAHIQTLVTVLTTVAADVENPDPRANAVALTLRAERLEKDPATKHAVLQQAAPWKALADQENQKSLEELKAAVAELQRRSATKRE